VDLDSKVSTLLDERDEATMGPTLCLHRPKPPEVGYPPMVSISFIHIKSSSVLDYTIAQLMEALHLTDLCIGFHAAMAKAPPATSPPLTPQLPPIVYNVVFEAPTYHGPTNNVMAPGVNGLSIGSDDSASLSAPPPHSPTPATGFYG
jgi:hypothetical protein